MDRRTVVLLVSGGLVMSKQMKQSISTNQDKAAKSGRGGVTNPPKEFPTVSVKWSLFLPRSEEAGTWVIEGHYKSLL